MDDLDRLYQRVLHNVRENFPEFLHRPFTVQELYDQIVPYRHNRKELGIDTNQDYEVAITRLLSGERGFVSVDEKVSEALRNDLASPAGSEGASGLFREFGDASVTLEKIDVIPTSQSQQQASTGPTSTFPPLNEIQIPEGCKYCGGTLPEGREITYCPHCGQNLSIVRCPGCGSELESGWKFCITCGRAGSR